MTLDSTRSTLDVPMYNTHHHKHTNSTAYSILQHTPLDTLHTLDVPVYKHTQSQTHTLYHTLYFTTISTLDVHIHDTLNRHTPL